MVAAEGRPSARSHNACPCSPRAQWSRHDRSSPARALRAVTLELAGGRPKTEVVRSSRKRACLRITLSALATFGSAPPKNALTARAGQAISVIGAASTRGPTAGQVSAPPTSLSAARCWPPVAPATRLVARAHGHLTPMRANARVSRRASRWRRRWRSFLRLNQGCYLVELSNKRVFAHPLVVLATTGSWVFWLEVHVRLRR